MKDVIATVGLAIGLAITLYSAFGEISTAIDFINVAKPAIEGNVTETVEKGSYFLSDWIIGVAYWTLAIALISAVLAIFGIRIRSS
jgi:hypothetical protein